MNSQPTPKRLMIGQSTEINRVYEQLVKLAQVELAVLIFGETGTGKELAAMELHRLSKRRSAPFVAVNIAAIPENLLEAELFGYRKGSFTGAQNDHTGYIEKADGGVLFLDEIGEMPLHLQAKLLRVIQERQITRIGETRARPAQFRLVTATHVNLPKAIAAGQFRQDLYYRIAGAVVELPPLRLRGSDVIRLAEHLQSRFCQQNDLTVRELSETAMHSLRRHSWDGNVRELQNVVERAAVFADSGQIHSQDLDLDLPAQSYDADEIENLEVAKSLWLKNHIERVLKRYGGHKGKTALALGVGRRTLFRYMEDLQIRV